MRILAAYLLAGAITTLGEWVFVIGTACDDLAGRLFLAGAKIDPLSTAADVQHAQMLHDRVVSAGARARDR